MKPLLHKPPFLVLTIIMIKIKIMCNPLPSSVCGHRLPHSVQCLSEISYVCEVYGHFTVLGLCEAYGCFIVLPCWF